MVKGYSENFSPRHSTRPQSTRIQLNLLHIRQEKYEKKVQSHSQLKSHINTKWRPGTLLMILSTVSLTHTHTHVTVNANIITMVSYPELEVQVAAMVSEVLNQYSNTIIAVDAQNPTQSMK